MTRRRPVPLRTRPRVSVVVPCYNYGRYLPDAVGSALDQSGLDVDVLIVDDCSTDDSAAVALRLADADPRVRLLRHETNRGHIQTYNDGLAAVTGDYVVLLSADDLLTPDSLTRAVALMEAHPRVGLVYGPLETFSDATPVPGGRQDTAAIRWRVWPGADWARRVARSTQNPIYSPEAVVRMAACREVGGYDPDLPHAGDMHYWLRVALGWDVGHVGGAVQARYREHGANMHSRRFASTISQLEQRYAALEPYLRSSQGRADLDRIRRRLFNDPLTVVERLLAVDRWNAELDELIGLCDRCWPEWRTTPRWASLARGVELRAGGARPEAALLMRAWLPGQVGRVRSRVRRSLRGAA